MVGVVLRADAGRRQRPPLRLRLVAGRGARQAGEPHGAGPAWAAGRQRDRHSAWLPDDLAGRGGGQARTSEHSHGLPTNVERHIAPRIGRKKLGKTRNVRQMLDGCRAAGLSDRSVRTSTRPYAWRWRTPCARTWCRATLPSSFACPPERARPAHFRQPRGVPR